MSRNNKKSFADATQKHKCGDDTAKRMSGADPTQSNFYNSQTVAEIFLYHSSSKKLREEHLRRQHRSNNKFSFAKVYDATIKNVFQLHLSLLLNFPH